MSRSKKEEENKGEQLVRVPSRDGQKIAKDYNCIEALGRERERESETPAAAG